MSLGHDYGPSAAARFALHAEERAEEDARTSDRLCRLLGIPLTGSRIGNRKDFAAPGHRAIGERSPTRRADKGTRP